MSNFSLRSTLRMIRPSARLIRIFVVFILLYTIYIFYDRYAYERLLDRLYITFDDFPKDYARALSALPDDGPLKSYDYSTSFPPGHEPPNTIPSIIHFIWYKDLYETHKEVTDIPSMGSHAPEVCQKHNPDFQINIWNASAGRDLLEQHYKWFLPIYDGYTHPIQRVDAIKYFILLHHGGFYLDLDIACRRSLAPIQPFPAWVPRARPLGLNNDALAFRAHHPAMEKMTKTLKPRNKNLLFPYLTIFWSTGPQFTTDVVKMWFDEQYRAGRDFYVPGSSKMPSDPDEVYILPQEFYSEEYTFFGHSPGGTWHEEDVAVILWFVARPWLVMLITSSLVFVCVAFAYRKWRQRRMNRTSPQYERVNSVEMEESAIS